MSLGMEAGIFLAYACGVLFIFFFGKLLLVPIKKLLKLLINSLLGGVCLLLINAVGAGIGIMVPVNIVTAMAAGILGLPGVICMIIFA